MTGCWVSRTFHRLSHSLGRKTFSVLAVLILALPLVTSCYVPDDFLAELRIAANGDYALTYRGRLIWAPLFRDVKEGKLTPAEIAEKERAVLDDLARDSAFSELKPIGAGVFQVVYERSGRFTGTRQVSFPRRGVEILYLELRTNGQLYVAVAPKANNEKIGELEKLGLLPNGRFRVITNAKVVGHNAPKPPQPLKDFAQWQVYDWSITGREKTQPQMAISLSAPQPVQGFGTRKPN